MIPIEPVGEEIETGMKATFRRLTGEGLLPRTSIPFGRDPGGNFFLLDPKDERVWYMPIDKWDQTETAAQNWERFCKHLAPSIEAFFGGLQEEIEYWIDRAAGAGLGS